MSERTKQLDVLLRQEIAEIVNREVGDPRVGFVTITDVETAPDLRHAQVWVSVIGQPAERDATIAALVRAMPFVRRELGRRLRLRRIPDLHVRLDETAERGTRVLQLLHELEADGDAEPELAVGESLPTPVARLPHEGDLQDEPASAVVPPVPARRRRTKGGPGRKQPRSHHR